MFSLILKMLGTPLKNELNDKVTAIFADVEPKVDAFVTKYGIPKNEFDDILNDVKTAVTGFIDTEV